MVSDAQFWGVVNSPHFKRRFRGQHPLLPDNGGVDFYNVDALNKRIKHCMSSLAKARDPKNRGNLQHHLDVLKSWVAQVQWVNDHPLYSVN